MAGPIRTVALTAWGLRGKTSNHFATLRTECRLPLAEREPWVRVFHELVGDTVLLMGAPGSKK